MHSTVKRSVEAMTIFDILGYIFAQSQLMPKIGYFHAFSKRLKTTDQPLK